MTTAAACVIAVAMRAVNLAGWLVIGGAFATHRLGHGAAWEPPVTFALAGIGIVPLALAMGEATEHLAARTGPTWGGLLNATFGNAAELIIAAMALHRGLPEVVKASLTGSILGNLLLVGGAAMFAGGWGRERQRFSRRAAEANVGLLVLGVAAMLTPAIFHFTAERLHDREIAAHEQAVSIGTSLVLLAVYALGLLFTLRTHAHVFTPPPHGGRVAAHTPNEATWSARRAVAMLLLASAGVGVVAELLVGSAAAMAEALGWSQVFVGVVLLAVIGNAAEHSTAVLLAMRDDMDTAMTIVHQSSLQIALFVTPVLVLLGAAMAACGIGAGTPLDLVFSALEVAAVLLAVLIVAVLGLNGETNWFEGALLIGVYVILGVAFFFVPAG